MKVLVVPSNRPESLAAFFEAWKGRGGWDRIVVVYDGSKDEAAERVKFASGQMLIDVYAWDDIDAKLGASSWIVSRKDSAIRSFGFLMAWHMGADYVLTLDDDCYPSGFATNFLAAHIANMEHPVWIPSAGFRTRGLPYKNLGSVRSKVNVGLWNNVEDWDSIQSMTELADRESQRRSNARSGMQIDKQTLRFMRQGNDVVPAGQMVPMCGMNLCFHRDAIPLMYFLLMGQGQPYARFDDIWAGVIAKKVMDRLGWLMSVGEPHVKHLRASDPFKNLVKEAPGIAVNETFWGTVWNVELTATDALNCMRQIADELQCSRDAYTERLGNAINTWTQLFEPGAIEVQS